MNLVQSLRTRLAGAGGERRYSLEQWVKDAYFSFNGSAYPVAGFTSTMRELREDTPEHFEGLVQSSYRSNGVIFACMLARLMVFSAARLRYQRFSGGRPGGLFGDQTLELLERPWPGGTTQDLLTRMIQDADLAGNHYLTLDSSLARTEKELVRLRPDWTSIVLEPRTMNGGQVGFRRIGYAYTEGGLGTRNDPVPLALQEVTHFAPVPDPLASYRGMSWLTPVIREVQGDKLMSAHKVAFFENGATPNLVIKFDPAIKEDDARRFEDWFRSQHQGADNAYGTVFIGGGADLTPVGASFEQMDFKVVQGHGETRIAAAAGVPPIIVGLSEGLDSATYSNYAQARRRFADGTIHPLWQNASGSLQTLVPAPSGSRLWYDAAGVPFLREDAKDQAEIFRARMLTVESGVRAGFQPESVVAAVDGDDLNLLQHTGLFSVQLQPPDTGTLDDPAPPDDGGDGDGEAA